MHPQKASAASWKKARRRIERPCSRHAYARQARGASAGPTRLASCYLNFCPQFPSGTPMLPRLSPPLIAAEAPRRTPPLRPRSSCAPQPGLNRRRAARCAQKRASHIPATRRWTPRASRRSAWAPPWPPMRFWSARRAEARPRPAAPFSPHLHRAFRICADARGPEGACLCLVSVCSVCLMPA